MRSDEGSILFAYDGSDNARRAVVVGAGALASRTALVATVWESVLTAAYRHPMPADLGVVRDVVEELDLKTREAAEACANEGASLARDIGLAPEAVALRSNGDILEALLGLAEERSASALVVGSRGRSRSQALLLGSVAYGAIYQSPRPVLVVPPVEA